MMFLSSVEVCKNFLITLIFKYSINYLILLILGATGAGCALDSCTRGLKTALVEASDFASGTSSRSTKLIHGGVRYLQKAILGVNILYIE